MGFLVKNTNIFKKVPINSFDRVLILSFTKKDNIDVILNDISCYANWEKDVNNTGVELSISIKDVDNSSIIIATYETDELRKSRNILDHPYPLDRDVEIYASVRRMSTTADLTLTLSEYHNE